MRILILSLLTIGCDSAATSVADGDAGCVDCGETDATFGDEGVAGDAVVGGEDAEQMPPADATEPPPEDAALPPADGGEDARVRTDASLDAEVMRICEPGSGSCEGEIYRRCSDDGTGIAERDCADTDTICNPDAGCMARACQPGGPIICEDRALIQCNARGDAFELVELCPDGCFQDRCVVCGDGRVEGPEICDDGDDDQCNECIDCRHRRHVVLDAIGRNRVVFEDAAAPLELQGTPFTVELWARIDDAEDLIDLDRRGADNGGWRLSVQAEVLTAAAFGVADYTVPSPVELGRWHHYAWSWDGAEGRLFFDGLLIHTYQAGEGPRATEAPLHLSAARDAEGEVDRYSNGRVDEIRISGVARYVDDFSPTRRVEADGDTLALWHLDVAGGGNFDDATGNGHSGRFLAPRLEPDDGFGGRFCGDCAEGQCGLIDFVPIPASGFDMGGGDHGPVHRVDVPGFDLGRSEVTVGVYRRCVAAGVCEAPHWADGGCDVFDGGARAMQPLPQTMRGMDQPATCLTRAQAEAFAAWVGGRLPSEAEWEVAARGGDRGVTYPWGEEDANCARVVKSEGSAGCGTGAAQPVCSLPAGQSLQGLCDLAGNVAEMTADAWHPDYAGAPADGSAWMDPLEPNYPMRGGAWHHGPAIRLTVFARASAALEQATDYLGFRVAR